MGTQYIPKKVGCCVWWIVKNTTMLAIKITWVLTKTLAPIILEITWTIAKALLLATLYMTLMLAMLPFAPFISRGAISYFEVMNDVLVKTYKDINK